MVRDASLNPFGLDWERFTVATEKSGRLVGCVQWKEHGDGSRELASLVVSPSWRGQGVARALIFHLLGAQPLPLWLMCASELVTFYGEFGFREITDPARLPPYFRRIRCLADLFRRFSRQRRYLAVMVRPAPPTPHEG